MMLCFVIIWQSLIGNFWRYTFWLSALYIFIRTLDVVDQRPRNFGDTYLRDFVHDSLFTFNPKWTKWKEHCLSVAFWWPCFSEVHSEPGQTAKVDRFAKVVNAEKPLNIFTKRSILMFDWVLSAFTFNVLSSNGTKWWNTQTFHRKQSMNCFECVWPFRGVGA